MELRNLGRFGSVFFAVLACTNIAVAQDRAVKQDKSVSPTGSWTWERESGSGMMRCLLTLTEKDGKVKGKFKDDELELDVENGTFKDGELEVHFTIEMEDQEFQVTLKGLVKDKEIKGKVLINLEEGVQEVDWLAKRTITLDDVTGKWQMNFTTPDGQEMQPQFELTNVKGKPSVKFVDGTGDISNVKFKDGQLTFSMALDYDGQPLEVDYDLSLSGDSLDGMLHFSFVDADNEGDLEIGGKRIK